MKVYPFGQIMKANLLFMVKPFGTIIPFRLHDGDAPNRCRGPHREATAAP